MQPLYGTFIALRSRILSLEEQYPSALRVAYMEI